MFMQTGGLEVLRCTLVKVKMQEEKNTGDDEHIWEILKTRS